MYSKALSVFPPELQPNPLIYKWSLLKHLSCPHPQIFSSSIVSWYSFSRFSFVNGFMCLIWAVCQYHFYPLHKSLYFPMFAISLHFWIYTCKTVNKEHSILTSGELACVKTGQMAEEVWQRRVVSSFSEYFCVMMTFAFSAQPYIWNLGSLTTMGKYTATYLGKEAQIGVTLWASSSWLLIYSCLKHCVEKDSEALFSLTREE